MASPLTLHGDPEECYRFGCWEKARHLVRFTAEGFEQLYCTEHVVDYAEWPGAQIEPYRESPHHSTTAHTTPNPRGPTR